MSIKFAALFAFLTLCLPMVAQSTDFDKMVEIKLSEDYIFGEATADNVLAYDFALNDLCQFVNEWREENGKPPIKPTDLNGVAEEMLMESGAMSVCFLYITREKALEIVSTSRKDMVDNMTSGGATVVEAQPVQTPKPKEEHKLNFVNTKPKDNVQPAAPKQQYTAPSTLDDDIIAVIGAQDNWTEIKGFLSQYKELKKIRETGYATSMAQVPDDAYCLLIDEMYGVLSYLSPSNGGRTNLKTKAPDSENNYPDCKVIVWYK